MRELGGGAESLVPPSTAKQGRAIARRAPASPSGVVPVWCFEPRLDRVKARTPSTVLRGRPRGPPVRHAPLAGGSRVPSTEALIVVP